MGATERNQATSNTKDLDALAMRGLWLMNEIIVEREALNSTLKTGFIEMAQARYILGSTAVSALKFPAVMKASYVVESESENLKDKLDSASEEAGTVTVRSLVRADLSKIEDSGDEDEDSLEIVTDLDGGGDAGRRTEETGLRRRRGATGQSKPEEEVEKSEEPVLADKKLTGSASKFNAKRDPLRWFGVLVPSSLRRSQTDFRSAVEASVRLVNYQEELARVVAEFRRAKSADNKIFTEE